MSGLFRALAYALNSFAGASRQAAGDARRVRRTYRQTKRVVLRGR